MSSDWTWRVADTAVSRGMRLRYEPGNLGDLLKAAWLLAIARPRCKGRLVYGDPFAGAPSYALSDGARARWEALPEGPVRALQEPFLARDRLASSASLLLAQVAALGGSCEARVFDADHERRAAWEAEAHVVPLAVDDGYAALSTPELSACQLVLLDPYDLDKRWSHACRALPGLLAGGPDLVLYLYNRSPRGAGHFDEYRAFRRHLAQACGREPLVGRIPADPRLPRAWHEVLWIPAPDAPVASLAPALQAWTEALAWRLLRAGVCEGFGGDAG